MTPDPDWSNPVAVERHMRKIRRRDMLVFVGAIIIGLLSVAAFLVYERFHPVSEQDRQRARARIKSNLGQPVTRGDLLAVTVMLVGFGGLGMAIVMFFMSTLRL